MYSLYTLNTVQYQRGGRGNTIDNLTILFWGGINSKQYSAVVCDFSFCPFSA